MKHIHEKTGTPFQVGRLIDFDGRTFDITVITLWDEEHDFEASPVIVGYYFGDYDQEVTDDYIDMYIEEQNSLKKVVKYLRTNNTNLDIEAPDETIKTLDGLISQLV